MAKTLWTLLGLLLIMLAASCSKRERDADFAALPVVLVSREEGSGTRGAFVELFGIEQAGAVGHRVDMISEAADVTNSSEVMISLVAANKGALGYVSLGSLKESVRALKVDGVYPSVQAIKSGGYKAARPFNLVTKAQGTSDVADDFIRFALSEGGQKLVEEAGYIAAWRNPRYVATGKSGRLSIAGSSSAAPLMQKLASEYSLLCPAVTAQVQLSDSTTGISCVLNGACDIGVASRDLTRAEQDEGAVATLLATDGIALIVNRANPLEGISHETVRRLFTGEISKWGDVP